MRANLLPDLKSKTAALLRRAGTPMSAKDIAKKMGVLRSEVNSMLYSSLGREFLIVDGNPPTWVPMEALEIKAQANLPKFKKIDHEIHVDAPGGDWKMKIQVAPMSVNDPVAIVESYGPRSRLITVSSAVSRTPNGEETLPESCLAIASAMLAWEIIEKLQVDGIENVDFGKLLRDIYLSIGAHSRRDVGKETSV